MKGSIVLSLRFQLVFPDACTQFDTYRMVYNCFRGELTKLVTASREGGWRFILTLASAIRNIVLKLRHQKNHFQG